MACHQHDIIDFASRFTQRQLDAIILELDFGTIKVESGACDLLSEGLKSKDNLIDVGMLINFYNSLKIV